MNLEESLVLNEILKAKLSKCCEHLAELLVMYEVQEALSKDELDNAQKLHESTYKASTIVQEKMFMNEINVQKDLVKKLASRLEFHEDRWRKDVEKYESIIEGIKRDEVNSESKDWAYSCSRS